MLRLAMLILWPSFLVAIMAEGFFFSLFDPVDLLLVGGMLICRRLRPTPLVFFLLELLFSGRDAELLFTSDRRWAAAVLSDAVKETLLVAGLGAGSHGFESYRIEHFNFAIGDPQQALFFKA